MSQRTRCDQLTAWHSDDRGQTWRATVYRGVHVEAQTLVEPGQTGLAVADVLRAWVFSGCGIEVGDYVAPRASAADRPPEDARRVVGVAPFTEPRGAHHWEVTAQ